MELPNSIEEEIQDAKQSFPQINILSATNSFLSGSYERTLYTRVKFTLTFPPEYPDRALIVDVASDSVVPPGLKKKLEKDFVQDLPLSHHQQITLVFTRLVRFVDNNKFLPCWRELKQSVNLVRAAANGSGHGDSKSNRKSNGGNTNTNTNSNSIAIIESKGKIKLKLSEGEYYYRCNIIINDGYPSTTTNEEWGKPCQLNFEATNFPTKIETMITSQAKELVRRLQDGMSHEDALKFSNPVKAPKNNDDNGKKKEVKVRLTQEKLKGLKQDIETLSRVRNLREVNSAVTQGNARIKVNAAKDRKDARRTIKKITAEEMAKDQSIEEKDKQWQEDEDARMAGYNISEHDGSNPQRSLLSLVTFLKEKIQRLPVEVCPSCQKNTLPSDPNQLKALYISASDCKTEKEKKARKAAKAKRPIRTYCGHWWHYSCLNKYMTEPPFGLSCPAPGCGRRVYHPDWPDDISQLERAWAGQQARLREIQDAAMFL